MGNNTTEVSARKRSIGVLIFSCLIILFAVFSIKGSLAHIQLFKIKGIAGITLHIAILISFIEIILAINILRLKDWARKYLVLISIIYLALTLYSFRNAITIIEKQWDQIEEAIGKEKMQEVRLRMEKQIEQAPLKQQENMRKMYQYFKPQAFMKWLVIIIFGINILWRLIVIFFFTRPRLKMQFMVAGAHNAAANI